MGTVMKISPQGQIRIPQEIYGHTRSGSGRLHRGAAGG